MKNKFSFFLWIFCVLTLLGIFQAAMAQMTVQGRIEDATTGEPLPGVNIIIQGTNKGTISGMDGEYSLELEGPNDVLQFSYIGYLNEIVPVAGQSIINIQLTPDVTALDEVVVVGYGTQRKSDLTGAVAVVETEELEKKLSPNIANLLQGAASGVQVTGSYVPGGVPDVKIRGISSFGSTSPLYIVDGVPISNSINISGGQYTREVVSGGLKDFNPADIESVQVLKDASACAIYGARGANGVIIITTKRGKEGKMKVSYSGSYGWQKFDNFIPMTNTAQFQEVHNLARLNSGQTIAPANDDTSKYYISMDSVNTNWQEEFYKPGYTTSHSLTFSGGKENSNYYIGLNYIDENGIMVGPGPRYSRYSVKVNTDQERGRFKLGQSFYYGRSNQLNLMNTQWENPYIVTLIAIPTVPVYDPSNKGGYGGGELWHDQIAGNPVGFNNLKQSDLTTNRFFGVMYGEFEILEGLKLKSQISYDRSDFYQNIFIPEFEIGTRHVQLEAWLIEERSENPYLINENTLTFNRTFGKHSITAMGGYTVQKDYLKYIRTTAKDFTEPYIKEIAAAQGEVSADGKLYEHAIVSYLGRFNYIYNDIILATVNFRKDWSSRFGPKNKSGIFPSYALGWKISNMSFFNIEQINMLKVRASYGKIGNENIGDYLFDADVNQQVSYVFNRTLAPGTIQTNLLDSRIHWEERITKGAGVDLNMFQNKLELTADYYFNEAKDLLLALPIPLSTGDVGGEITTNTASLTNQGIELNVSYKNNISDFSYRISGNLTTLKNEVTKLGNIDQPIEVSVTYTEVGGSMGDLYGFKVIGIVQDDDDINSFRPGNIRYDSTLLPYQDVATGAGDFIYADINGFDENGNLTGEPDGQVNDADKVVLGSAFPKLTYGINLELGYKGFDLSVFLNGIYGNKVYNGVMNAIEFMGETNYTLNAYENYWRPVYDGEGNVDVEAQKQFTYPRPLITPINRVASDFWIEDGSFLRIQNVQFGYSLPSNLLDNISISNCRLYVSVQNLHVFTKYRGYDPEFAPNDEVNSKTYSTLRGIDIGSYPFPRTISIGAKIDF
ncbi:MAG: TonB-dependent receptor [Bacteroidales bacterium]|nr:TonB-dependent receptor [Bacteroidales bacterium]